MHAAEPAPVGGLGALVAWFERREAKRLQSTGFAAHDVPVRDGDYPTQVRIWDAPGQGALPPVVFLHGLGGDTVTCGAVLSKLRKRCQRVISIDLPGHGHSPGFGTHLGPAPKQPYMLLERSYSRVRQALDAHLKEVPRFTLMSHSLGCYFAQRYAHEGLWRQRAGASILLAPDGGHFDALELAKVRNLLRVTEPKHDMVDTCRRLWPESPIKAFFMAPFVKAIFAQPNMRYIVESDLLQPYVSPQMLRSQPPTCLVWGTEERLQLPSNREYFLANLPSNREFIEPKGMGHAALIDAREPLFGALFDFMGRVANPSA